MPGSRKAVIAAAAGVAVAMAVATAAYWMQRPKDGLTMASSFSAQQWRDEGTRNDERSTVRHGMLDALERDHLRNGMLRQAVRQLLGPPDVQSAAADEYDLGRSPVGATYEAYVIEYDSTGRVVRFGLQRR